jgi:hypothetical protein
MHLIVNLNSNELLGTVGIYRLCNLTSISMDPSYPPPFQPSCASKKFDDLEENLRCTTSLLLFDIAFSPI